MQRGYELTTKSKKSNWKKQMNEIKHIMLDMKEEINNSIEK
jgi:hypothetical protein